MASSVIGAEMLQNIGNGEIHQLKNEIRQLESQYDSMMYVCSLQKEVMDTHHTVTDADMRLYEQQYSLLNEILTRLNTVYASYNSTLAKQAIAAYWDDNTVAKWDEYDEKADDFF